MSHSWRNRTQKLFVGDPAFPPICWTSCVGFWKLKGLLLWPWITINLPWEKSFRITTAIIRPNKKNVDLCTLVIGKTIVPDQWTAWSTIKDMPEEYQHESINHSLHFTDPEIAAWTNTIHSVLQKFKERHEFVNGVGHKGYLNSYMDKFVWKKVYGDSVQFLVTIPEHHPPPPG